VIKKFYSIYHSSRWVKQSFVIRLNQPLSTSHLQKLNQDFADILMGGAISPSQALPEEMQDTHLLHLPRLVMNFNQISYGRLYDLIWAINDQACTNLTPDRK
jgi:hypothetical protein